MTPRRAPLALAIALALSGGRGAAAAPPGTPGGRLLVLDFAVQGAAPRELGRALGDVAAAEAARVGGFAVLSQGDVAARLGLEKTKQMLGCAEDEGCMVEIAGALDADRLLAGSVTLLDGTYLLAVKLMDVRRSRSVARTGDTLRGATQEELVDGVRRLAHEALTGRKLDTTGVIRIDVAEAGAEVALDGRSVGTTPLHGSGQRVIEGAHRLVVQKPGFVRWEGTVSVTAGATVPLQVSLVPVAALEAERRAFVEVFGGVTPSSRYTTANLAGCSGGCVGNLGGVRGGFLFAGRYAVEAVLVPFVGLTRTQRRSVSVVPFDLATYASSEYEDFANVSATYGGVSGSVRFLDRTPVVLRLTAGAARGGVTVGSGGRFPGSPSGRYERVDETTSFWGAVFGGEVSAGWRFSRAISASVGVGALGMVLPKTAPETGPARQDPEAALPAGPAFAGGVAWFFPVTLGVRWDL